MVFRDTKEGMFGLRVARGLEQPADKPEVFTDAAGRPEKCPRSITPASPVST